MAQKHHNMIRFDKNTALKSTKLVSKFLHVLMDVPPPPVVTFCRTFLYPRPPELWTSFMDTPLPVLATLGAFHQVMLRMRV